MAPPKLKTPTGYRAPVTELGGVQGSNFIGLPGQKLPWSTFHDLDEFVPELTWPRSVLTYRKMSADSQLSALFKATVFGVMKMKWSIDPNGCEEEMVQKYSKDYNLPILGEKVNQRYRAKRRFAFRQHMWKAFKAGQYGHYYFEQVGYIDPKDNLWHLRKLAERPPATIQDFRIAEDGGLISIVQNIPSGNMGYWGMLPEIPIDRMVGYVWDQEGSNWAGRSWFRNVYKNWVIKDRLMRIDAVNHERAGGVPYIEAHPGASYAEIDKLNEMAQAFRIGDTSGGAVPNGAKLVIAKGTNSSVISSIEYHDQAMAREWMLMIMQLGQTDTGSRALGREFIDFWGHGLASIADWFRDIFNEHVIEDDVDWNYGEDVDKVPLLTYEFDPEFSAQELEQMISCGAIEVDEELEAYVRREMGVTDKGTPRMNPALDKGTERDPLAQQNIDIQKTAAETKATGSGNQQPDNGGGKS